MKYLKNNLLIFLHLFLVSIIMSCHCDHKTSIDRYVENEENEETISELVIVKVDYSNMPSYCSPKNYKILQVPVGYKIQLIGGYITHEVFNTIDEAQKGINKRAKNSKQRWIDSGGIDF